MFVGRGGHFWCDVEVYPRTVEFFGKDFQKLAAADDARVAAVAGCGDVRHIRKAAFDYVVVLLPHRHRCAVFLLSCPTKILKDHRGAWTADRSCFLPRGQARRRLLSV